MVGIQGHGLFVEFNDQQANVLAAGIRGLKCSFDFQIDLGRDLLAPDDACPTTPRSLAQDPWAISWASMQTVSRPVLGCV
jgi:hypothetical protein